MRILAPLSRVQEVEVLARCGADEFYMGIMPAEWVKRFSTSIWTNRRGPVTANFIRMADLGEAVSLAHGLGKECSIAFNAPYYTQAQMEVLLPMISEIVEEVNPDGLIISDVGLMLALRDRGIAVPIAVSTLAVAQNVEAIGLFGEIGARRVILPRQLSLDEIESIRSRATGMILEAFVLNDTCVFQEGHCHTQHNVPQMESFCYTPWEYSTLTNVDLRPVSGSMEERWRSHLEDYREWLWYCKNCGYTMTLRGLTNGACGLCAIPRLDRAGVDVLKIVGRESSIDRKAKSVIVVRRIIDAVRAGKDDDEVMEESRRLRGTPEFCESGYMCYYRDALRLENGSLKKLPQKAATGG